MLQQQDGFKNVDDRIKALISALSKHQTRFDQLALAIEQSMNMVKAHITAETSRLEGAVTAGTRVTLRGIAKLESMLITKAQHEQILNSLKYPTMNERRNQLTANMETCNWIFGAKEDVISKKVRQSSTKHAKDPLNNRS